MRVSDILTEEGEQWFRDIRVTEEEVAGINSLLAEGALVDVAGMSYNCGATEIRSCTLLSREKLLYALIVSASRLISEAGVAEGHGRGSILVATFNDQQEESIEIFTSVGFKQACEWVENPNSGNDIIAYVLALPPNLFNVPEEEEDDGGDWGHDVEEEDYDY